MNPKLLEQGFECAHHHSQWQVSSKIWLQLYFYQNLYREDTCDQGCIVQVHHPVQQLLETN